MATIKVTKGWIEQYFGIKIDRPEQYSSYWQTDGGTATQDFDRLPEDEYELVHRAPSKTYWGKYVHPTVPPPPFGAEQHTQRRTATYGDADRYKKQIIAGWKAGSGVREGNPTKESYRTLIEKHVTDMEKYRTEMDAHLKWLKIDISHIPVSDRDKAWDAFAQEEHLKSQKAWMDHIKKHPKELRALSEYESGG